MKAILLLLYVFSMPVLAQDSISKDSGSLIVIKTIAALLFVIGMIFALSWLAKKTPALKNKRSDMKVLGSLSLGAKERIVSIEVGHKKVLLGVTQTHISLLDIDQPKKDKEEQFHELLKAEPNQE